MEKLKVEVVYARPQAQEVVAVTLEPGATVADALETSGLLARHPELRERTHAVGIHGKVVSRTQRVADGDRVEIYRTLLVDPKEARRARARKR